MTTQVIRENSALHLALVFTDENGNSIVPSTVEYRVDDVTNDAEVLDWTSLSPASTLDLVISGQLNYITDSTKISERRRITIRIDDGLPTEANEDSDYLIKNLSGAT